MLKKTAFILSALAASTAAHGSLIITGVFDGPLTGGTPKGVELYASSAIADLSQWAIGSANNGGGSDGPEFTLSGSATAGQFLYVASESTEFNNWFGFAPTFTDGAANVNGDDAIELFFDATGTFGGGETLIDVFGDQNVDGTGQTWEYMDGWAYRAGGSASTTWNAGDWNTGNVNAWDGETSNATAASPMAAGTYAPVPEPSFYAALAGVLTLGFAIYRRKRARA